jgi:hypothetical protein
MGKTEKEKKRGKHRERKRKRQIKKGIQERRGKQSK